MSNRLAWLGILVVVGCSSGGGSPAGSGGATSGSGGATGGNGGATGGGGAPGGLVGNVHLDLFATGQYATVAAQFFDGVPARGNGPVEVTQEQDGCKLLTPVTCPTDCADGFYCSGTKQCASKPSPVDVGSIKVDGISATIEGAAVTSVELTGSKPMFAYAAPTLQPYPPCAEGADVKAESTRFKFTGKCIAALEVTSPLPIPVVSGMPFHLTWKAPGKSGISRIQFTLEVAHHGGYRGQIDCDVPDTGSFDVPASMVTTLVARGLAGYPTVDVQRSSVATDPAQPGASLLVVSSVGKLEVDTGVISCGVNDADVCPDPTTCDVGTKICK